jgi:hypothetical protein
MLDPEEWREIHEAIRIDAGWMDSNDKLYVFLRLSKWEERKKLTGVVSGALWLRHIGEVIRRGFEEAFSEKWPEEYHAFGMWHEAASKRAFGSERPLDDPLRSKPYIAWTFGLFTGSSVRWYVEGETEYYAALEILEEPSRVGVELVNMRGNFSERDNAALKFQDWLKKDQALRRFSMVSFDRDLDANVKVITRQVRHNNIVGMIAVHEPDFEFANFAIEELVEIAARLDEQQGFSGEPIRKADWTGVKKGKAFEQKYVRVSKRARDLKGEAWGRALATYAAEHPRRADNQAERPFWRQIHAALHGWMSNYDEQKKRFAFDPQTFEIIANSVSAPSAPPRPPLVGKPGLAQPNRKKPTFGNNIGGNSPS